jgi:hypothetical protein
MERERAIREFGSVVRFATADRSAWSARRGGSNRPALLVHIPARCLWSVWYLHAVNGGVGGSVVSKEDALVLCLFAGSLSKI